MAQVNIDVAKEASVQAVNTKVGASTDTPSNTPTTMFSGIKSLISWFTNVWTTTRATKLDSIQTTLNTPDGNTLGAWLNYLQTTSQSSINLLNNATYGLNAIKTALASGGSIKSVQRGICDTYGSKSNVDLVVNINAVNMNKSIILVNGFHMVYSNSSDNLVYNPIATFVNSTQLAVRRSEVNSSYYVWTAVWQVIEFN